MKNLYTYLVEVNNKHLNDVFSANINAVKNYKTSISRIAVRLSDRIAKSEGETGLYVDEVALQIVVFEFDKPDEKIKASIKDNTIVDLLYNKFLDFKKKLDNEL